MIPPNTSTCISNLKPINDLKGVQDIRKINLQCKSSSYIQLNVHIKLRVAVLIEYTKEKH